tara:strand:+ start:15746 stop:16249 length:504 start_codon:yes stop_codon:yes gene_type:complete
MATAIWCTPLTIKKNSVINGDLDDDKLTYVIKNAQLIHIQNYLGTDLYEGLQTRSLAGTLTDIENALIDNYIEPALVFWSLSEYVYTGAYNISNKGILKHSDEQSETVSRDEIVSLGQSYEKTAQHFTERLVEYLCDKSNLFPEYSSNTGSDINPDKSSSYGGLYLD